MMSDKQITQLIDELEEAIAIQAKMGFIPGLMGLLKDSKEALAQLTDKELEVFTIGGDDIEASSIRYKNNESEIILIHAIEESSGTTSCCGKTLFEIPTTDKVVLPANMFEVTCGKGGPN